VDNNANNDMNHILVLYLPKMVTLTCIRLC